MKVTIIGRPEYQLLMDSETVALLMLLAQTHYDGTCRAAARPGGFLYGWANIVCWNQDTLDDSIEPQRCAASARELDLTLKLCEGAPHLTLAANRDLLQAYAVTARRALAAAPDPRHWTIEL